MRPSHLMDEERDQPSDAMIQHLARRLVDRYGQDAPQEAAQIVRLLTADANPDQARIWQKVRDACVRMVAKPQRTAPRKPQ
jgi:hypothetical protein